MKVWQKTWIFIFKILKHLLKNRCKEFFLGRGVVRRYTIIEIRWLFSIYIHEISTQAQDRFHTHAFKVVGFTPIGGYLEEQLPSINSSENPKRVKVYGVRFIPREMNHKLLRALPNTHTILFTGPCSHLWTEEDFLDTKGAFQPGALSKRVVATFDSDEDESVSKEEKRGKGKKKKPAPKPVFFEVKIEKSYMVNRRSWSDYDYSYAY